MCETFSAAVPGCSSCLIADGDPADSSYANYISGYLATVCPTANAAPFTTPCPICVEMESAIQFCTDNLCSCSTLSVSGPTCITCLVNDGNPLDVSFAGVVSASLYTDCNIIVTLPQPTASQERSPGLSPGSKVTPTATRITGEPIPTSCFSLY